jgi:hypothetical protein
MITKADRLITYLASKNLKRFSVTDFEDFLKGDGMPSYLTVGKGRVKPIASVLIDLGRNKAVTLKAFRANDKSTYEISKVISKAPVKKDRKQNLPKKCHDEKKPRLSIWALERSEEIMRARAKHFG